jgi:hypothetical protein
MRCVDPPTPYVAGLADFPAVVVVVVVVVAAAAAAAAAAEQRERGWRGHLQQQQPHGVGVVCASFCMAVWLGSAQRPARAIVGGRGAMHKRANGGRIWKN